MLIHSPHYSFEYFPPSTPELENKLWQVVQEMAPLNPDFVSVTYGAGGSTRERTHRIVRRLMEETQLSPAAHLTCVGSSKAEIHEIVEQYLEIGVNHFVALRGDPPKDQTTFTPHPDGYHYANELVAGLMQSGKVELSVAAYPEKHPEAPSLEFDIDKLKRKMDAGAVRAITQYFFDAATYFRYLEKVRAAGITLPIIPGIMPIYQFSQAARFSAMCGATIPSWLSQKFEPYAGDKAAEQQCGLEVAIHLCEELRAGGVDHFHFYTLNRTESVKAIIQHFVDQPAATSASIK